MDNNKNPSPLSKLVIVAVVISFFIGGLSGGFFGVLASQVELGEWFEKNILGRESNQDSFSGVNTSTLNIDENSATINAVKNVNPSVVSIIGEKDLSEIFRNRERSPFDDFFFSPFNIPEGKQEVSGGTGFIISEKGLILTNKHVVDDQDTDYSVILNDGREFKAEILAKDPTNDLAFLDIDATGLPVVELGDSDQLVIGQTVIAIGNALGQYRNTVTKGIVSGLSRKVIAGSSSGSSEVLEDTIQTDAAINPGNSGGPLINLAGQVVGVNTAISREGQLVGFAIPVNQAKKDIISIQEKGKIVRPFLGVRYVIVNERIKQTNDLKVDYGALLLKGDNGELAVVPGSPADIAGLEENDIILEFGGVKIDQDNSLGKLIVDKDPGDKVKLKILHDGEEKQVEVTLTEWSQE